ncbi:hypothetical protein EZY14_007385 [Kordia sp. TARA_039_SRF]|nr:hypothetical protein EZY14_007385 [Kordia sp. TARA_039_SRF]
MTKFYGGADFKILHYNFLHGDTNGKIFIMEGYESESVGWGKGAIIHLHKATPFLLNVIFEWFQDHPKGIVGDIKLLYDLVEKYECWEISKKIKRSHYNFNKRKKRMLSLHNILREHRSSQKFDIKQLRSV